MEEDEWKLTEVETDVLCDLAAVKTRMTREQMSQMLLNSISLNLILILSESEVPVCIFYNVLLLYYCIFILFKVFYYLNKSVID